jgi:hypothetical protein
MSDPIAWLKEWDSVGVAATGMRRVDLTPECETWLANMFPRITPLYAATAQGWISVKDRLPDDDCAVLVASWRYITGEQKVSSAHYSYGLESFTEHSVTHWQPLPVPPGEDAT